MGNWILLNYGLWLYLNNGYGRFFVVNQKTYFEHGCSISTQKKLKQQRLLNGCPHLPNATQLRFYHMAFIPSHETLRLKTSSWKNLKRNKNIAELTYVYERCSNVDQVFSLLFVLEICSNLQQRRDWSLLRWKNKTNTQKSTDWQCRNWKQWNAFWLKVTNIISIVRQRLKQVLHGQNEITDKIWLLRYLVKNFHREQRR
jgi:hypothetical protein